ncbi:MAG: archaemetzincin family Zn-dependent metalloprotease [Desulfomonilaceae bacterium]
MTKKPKNAKSPATNAGLITVVPLGRMGPDVVRVVSDSLQGTLRLPINLGQPVPLPQTAFMESRNQYNSMSVIKYLAEEHSRGGLKVLGITNKDLCTPILTYVFGEAYMAGEAAVVSCFRLYRGQAGEPVSTDHFLDRLVKVALHEVGHTFNVPHCHTGRCVMRASNSLKELDDKLNYLCNYCELFLSEAVAKAMKSLHKTSR